MDIIYTSHDRIDQGILHAVSLDVAYGSDENDFELIVDASSGIQLEPGALVYIEGTEYGGIVDAYSYSSREQTISYTGRTIHGILTSKIIIPPKGQDYLVAQGELHDIIRHVIEDTALNSLVKVSKESTGKWLKFQFNRYTNVWEALCALTARSSMRPKFAWNGMTLSLSVEDIVSHKALDTDIIEHSFTHIFRPINHLICLGGGQLRDRVVIDLFADEQGNVSQTQSLFGIDEVTATYDYNNAERDELLSEGIKKLKDLQDASSVEISLASDADYALGDIITSYDAATGSEITAQINKKIVHIKGDKISIEYKVGGSAKGTSLSSSSSASSSGGVSYAAGSGIRIEGGTISADVAKSDFDNLVQKFEATKKELSQAISNMGTEAQMRSAFLAAHPVGSVFITNARVNPQRQYGGTWKEIDTMYGHQYERIA